MDFLRQCFRRLSCPNKRVFFSSEFDAKPFFSEQSPPFFLPILKYDTLPSFCHRQICNFPPAQSSPLLPGACPPPFPPFIGFFFLRYRVMGTSPFFFSPVVSPPPTRLPPFRPPPSVVVFFRVFFPPQTTNQPPLFWAFAEGVFFSSRKSPPPPPMLTRKGWPFALFEKHLEGDKGLFFSFFCCLGLVVCPDLGRGQIFFPFSCGAFFLFCFYVQVEVSFPSWMDLTVLGHLVRILPSFSILSFAKSTLRALSLPSFVASNVTVSLVSADIVLILPSLQTSSPGCLFFPLRGMVVVFFFFFFFSPPSPFSPYWRKLDLLFLSLLLAEDTFLHSPYCYPPSFPPFLFPRRGTQYLMSGLWTFFFPL